MHSLPHDLATAELDYELPPDRIATRPAEPRDAARLLVMSRSNDEIRHCRVGDLPDFLHAGDALVFNTTAVAPARLIGRRVETQGQVEGLYLRDEPASPGQLRWRLMLKAGGRLRAGDRVELQAEDEPARSMVIRLVEKTEAEWIAEVEGGGETLALLDALGRTPLPPYILKARGEADVPDSADRAWYQTVYARDEDRRSVAAPTAGLHFTPQLLARLHEAGVERIDVTLHVGAGTFKPVTAQTLSGHVMHQEWCEVSPQALASLRAVRRLGRESKGENGGGGRVIAVGTTSVRTLESLPVPLPDVTGENCGGCRGMTDLLIAPPYEFKHVDGMLTNFHLPRSTLLALVAAMVGLDRLKSVYREAISRGYRFYSYGDAMLILP